MTNQPAAEELFPPTLTVDQATELWLITYRITGTPTAKRIVETIHEAAYSLNHRQVLVRWRRIQLVHNADLAEFYPLLRQLFEFESRNEMSVTRVARTTTFLQELAKWYIKRRTSQQ